MSSIFQFSNFYRTMITNTNFKISLSSHGLSPCQRSHRVKTQAGAPQRSGGGTGEGQHSRGHEERRSTGWEHCHPREEGRPEKEPTVVEGHPSPHTLWKAIWSLDRSRVDTSRSQSCPCCSPCTCPSFVPQDSCICNGENWRCECLTMENRRLARVGSFYDK